MNLMEAFTTLSKFEERFPDLLKCDPDDILPLLSESDRALFREACAAFENGDRDGELKKIIDRATAAAAFMPKGHYTIEQLFKAGVEGIEV